MPPVSEAVLEASSEMACPKVGRGVGGAEEADSELVSGLPILNQPLDPFDIAWATLERLQTGRRGRGIRLLRWRSL
jgi:hypothetical protein